MRAMLLDYQGRAIRFPEERWRHILIDHSEMAAMEYTIGETLADPDEIYRDPQDPNTVRLYYRWFNGLPVGDNRICVAIKVLNGDAYIITAFVASHIKGDELLWGKLTG